MFESSESPLYGCLIHCDVVGFVGLVFGFVIVFLVDLLLFLGGFGGWVFSLGGCCCCFMVAFLF